MDFEVKLKNIKTIQEAASLREILDPLSNEWQVTENKLRKLLKDKYKDEEILIIASEFIPSPETIFGDEYKDSILKNMENAIHKFGVFAPRYLYEYNPGFKQIIPYVVVINGELPKERIFAMIRKQGDPRLLGNISLGVGGHINPVDDTGKDILNMGLYRELHEEVNIKDEDIDSLELKGYIYDPTNLVGQDHIGLVYVLSLKTDNISIKETENLEGKWMTYEELIADYHQAENWSRLVIDNLL